MGKGKKKEEELVEQEVLTEETVIEKQEPPTFEERILNSRLSPIIAEFGLEAVRKYIEKL